MNPPRTGRPPIDDPRSEIYSVRTTKDEGRTLEAAAEAAGLPVSVFIREAALDKARSAPPDQ